MAGDDGSWMEGGLAESRTRTQRVLLSLVPEKLQDVRCLPETVKLWGCTGEGRCRACLPGNGLVGTAHSHRP